jgi:hypothetical protein
MSSSKLAIVCGGRDFDDFDRVEKAILEYHPTFLIEGKAEGADYQAGLVCQKHGISYMEVPPLWDAYGKSAGYRRNALMLKLMQKLAGGNQMAVIAMPGGRGTAMMVDLAEKAGVQVIHG